MCYIILAGSWFCSNQCEGLGNNEDHVRNYACAITWYGLLDMAHRDMIREADGLAMAAMWRINMTRFWANNNYKYLILGHRFLAGSHYITSLGILNLTRNTSVTLNEKFSLLCMMLSYVGGLEVTSMFTSNFYWCNLVS